MWQEFISFRLRTCTICFVFLVAVFYCAGLFSLDRIAVFVVVAFLHSMVYVNNAYESEFCVAQVCQVRELPLPWMATEDGQNIVLMLSQSGNLSLIKVQGHGFCV